MVSGEYQINSEVHALKREHNLFQLETIHPILAVPFLAVYCMQLSHAITCPFSKYFQILYSFPQVFKYFALFLTCFCPFSENLLACPYFLE